MGRFELYQDKKGLFRFRFVAANGQVIALSEAYSTKNSAMNGIESIRRNAAKAEIRDQSEE